MGMFDIIRVPCPKCGNKYDAQSKSGACNLDVFELGNAPLEVLANVNRHAPFECTECKAKFYVKFFANAYSQLYPSD